MYVELEYSPIIFQGYLFNAFYIGGAKNISNLIFKADLVGAQNFAAGLIFD